MGFELLYAKHILVIFQRLNSRDSFTGTGIGLVQCKKIMENHGGHISASGQEGAGVVFPVLLPARHRQQKKSRHWTTTNASLLCGHYYFI
ncbi:ATP-binding protein [Chitinophaga costaii]|uniref:ATP-binding protein n=1 Tax=Chitinophaga costaii TaxID=1335309 RepID=UPI00374433BE